MKLKELIDHIDEIEIKGETDIDISGIAYDSRKIYPGNLFVAWQGINDDGHHYIEKAYQRGATAVLVQKACDTYEEITQLIVKDPRAVMARMAKIFFKNPDHDLELVGVTGTNGKTTVSNLIYHILNFCGYSSGLISTIQSIAGKNKTYSERTTPESVDIYKLLSEMKGAQYAVIEASSHALAQNRLEGLCFHDAIFTNLSHDHLDFHKNMDAYLNAKTILFEKLYPQGKAILNWDDPYCNQLIDRLAVSVITFGSSSKAMIYVEDVEYKDHMTCFNLCYPEGKIQISTHLLGGVNVLNVLAAFAFVWTKKCHVVQIKNAIESFLPVEGRMQVLEIQAPFKVIIDYAHTPSALEGVLENLKHFARGKIVCLIGCGGNRDQEKRYLMGRIAGQSSDYVVLTTDNPRWEDPQIILEEMEKGVKETRTSYSMIEDRRQAIQEALLMMETNDLLLIAGKGHEKFQEVQGRRLPFNDALLVKDIYSSLGALSYT